MIGQLAVIVVTERLKSTLEVTLEHTRANNLLTFLSLRTSLCVVLAHVLIISCTESNYTLLAFVANIDTDQHRLPGDLCAEVQSPKVAAQLCVDLSQDVDVDSIIVLLDGLARHKLGDDGTVRVDLVLQGGVEVLLLDRIRHDDQEEVEILGLPWFRELAAV